MGDTFTTDSNRGYISDGIGVPDYLRQSLGHWEGKDKGTGQRGSMVLVGRQPNATMRMRGDIESYLSMPLKRERRYLDAYMSPSEELLEGVAASQPYKQVEVEVAHGAT